MLKGSGRNDVGHERVPRRLLAGIVCLALAGIVCSALVASLPGSSTLGRFLFGSAAEAERDPRAVAVRAATGAPAVVSATVGAADAVMPRAGGAVHVRHVVVRAYTSAVSLAPGACGLEVSLLAAIGQVESGNLAGQRLDADHRPDPPLLGPVLDGSNGLTAVPDTDGGQWDGDTTWDRAVGPLQFVPNAWRLAGFDFDTDGERNPQDIEDAAGAAMVFLCAGGDDLSTRSGLRSAIAAFNPTPSYVPLVLAWKAAFAAAGLDRAEAEPPKLRAKQYTRISRAVAVSTARTAEALDPSTPAATPYPEPSAPAGPGGPGAGAGPNPAAPGTPDRPGAAPPVVRPPGGGGSPGASPTPSPPGSTEPTPGEPGPAPNDPTPTPGTPSDPTPSDPSPSDPAPSDPTPSDPTPSDPAPSDPAPSDPAPSDPEPSDPAPSDPEPSDPAPSDPEPSDPAPSDPEPSNPAPSEPAPSEPSGPAQPSTDTLAG
jgi:hypothetical protein